MNLKLLEPIPEQHVLDKLPFGSRVYGTDTIDSDADYVVFIDLDCGDLVLQYGNDRVDYIYVNPFNFFKHIRKGSQPAFFEVAHSEKFITNILDYYTYEMAKCYLGLAKRDLKHGYREFHVNRCIWMAEHIMRKELIDLSKIEYLEVDYDSKRLESKIKKLRTQLNKQFKKT